MTTLSDVGEMVLIGGAIRDVMYYEREPRDLDIVVISDKVDLDHVFKEFEFTKNRFGGYKTYIDDVSFDVWSIQSHWAFREGLLEPKEENLPLTTFYNVDSPAYNISTHKCDTEIYEKAIHERLLDILLDDDVVDRNQHPEINIMRALLFKEEQGLSWSERLESYVSKWLHRTENPIQELKNAQMKHYGNADRIPESAFEHLRIC